MTLDDSTYPDSIPHDPVAEQSALAAIFLDPRRMAEVREILPAAEAFYSNRNAFVYRGMLSVHDSGRPVDLILVHSHAHAKWDFEGPACDVYLRSLLDEVPRSANAVQYAKVVADCWQRREAMNVAEKIRDMASEPGGAIHAARYFGKWAELAERNGSHEDDLPLDLAAVMAGEEPEIPWLVQGWLAEGELCILGGEWAAGKSYIALDLAISLATGLPWLGKIPVPKAQPVTYVDEENPPYVARRRLRRMLLGREIDPACVGDIPLHYMHGKALRLDRPEGLSRFSRILDRTKSRLLVLDSLIRFHAADENDNRAFADVVAGPLRLLSSRHECSPFALDHLRKPGKTDNGHDEGHRLRGASDKAGAVDDLWLLQGSRGEDTRKLSQHKSRGGDGLAAPITTKYVESEDGTACWIEATDATATNTAAVVGIVAGAGSSGIFANDLLAQLAIHGCARRSAYYAISSALKQRDIHRETVGRRVLYRGNGVGSRSL